MASGHSITSEEYAHAFEELKDKIRHRQWDMLEAFLHAPHHTLTATEAAEKAGYKSFVAFNSQFGALSGMFCDYLKYKPEIEWDGKSYKTSVLANLLKKSGDEEYRWKLKSEVTECLYKIRPNAELRG